VEAVATPVPARAHVPAETARAQIIRGCMIY
jgi:hypothetical protein